MDRTVRIVILILLLQSVTGGQDRFLDLLEKAVQDALSQSGGGEPSPAGAARPASPHAADLPTPMSARGVRA